MSKPIELMHVYFGENKNTCGTCCNLVEVIRGKKKLRKCKAYGGFHSSKADWAKKWVACGLYGEHVPQPMVSDVERLRLHANCMMDEWESTLCKRSEFITAANRIEQLRAELTNERIDNTNLIGELATVAAERDRYKAECENPQPSTNADRIRKMSDDELARFLSTKLNDDFYEYPDLTLQWLQQTAEKEV